VLGAAVGEVLAGKQIGNKALLWGAIGGTIPDLDVLGAFFMDEVEYVNFHRGISHSLIFAFITSPILGWLMYKSRWSAGKPFKFWVKLFFWTLFTHPLLDIFTSYGTQIFLPFSDVRVELNTIFIIDPAYTLPMLIALILIMFYRRDAMRRKKIIYTGMIVSHAYLLFTVLNKFLLVDPALREEIERQNLKVEMVETIPAPFQNFLWQGIIKTPNGYYAGYFNPRRGKVPFDTFLYFDRDLALENKLADFDKFKGLTEFSRNYHWVKELEANHYIYNDMRFSTTKGWLEKDSDFVFSFELFQKKGELSVQRKYPETQFEWKDLSRIFNRLITD